MKLLHICLGCFYVDNYSYQENLLPKFHRRSGYDVEIVASTLSFNSSGESCYVSSGQYINENGIKVTRLPYNKWLPVGFGRFLRVYDGLPLVLSRTAPDIIFVHGCQFLDIRFIVQYAKNHNVTIYVDNHADYSNSATNWVSKNLLHRILWRSCAQMILPYTSMFYGVLPARVQFLNDVYNIPKDRIRFLGMGVDDDVAKIALTKENRRKIRERLGVQDDEVLIITGGKIDNAKKQILTFLKFVPSLQNVKVFVFGSIIPDLEKSVMDLCDGIITHYIGWLNNVEVYSYIAASDLAVYPGRHSVIWEVTAGLGIPMIVKYWEGTNHIDMGGNAVFLEDDSEEEMRRVLNYVFENKALVKMKEVAQKERSRFSYERIAKESICHQ